MLGSPSNFLPRALFSDDETESVAETEEHTDAGWDMAGGAVKNAQQLPRYPSDSFSSDEEDGPLHWSGFHAQIEALLRTVQKQPQDTVPDPAQHSDTQAAEVQEAFCHDSGNNDGEATSSVDADGAASDSSAEELLAYMTGNTATRATTTPDTMKQKPHSEVYGRPLPSWLFDIATRGNDSDASGSQQGLLPSGAIQGAASGHAAQSLDHREGPGRHSANVGSARKKNGVPEWLTSPAQPDRNSRLNAPGLLPEAVSHTPFKSLIDEIEANLAAGFASKASTAFLYSDDAHGQPGNEGLQWFTNELAKAQEEACLRPGSPGSSLDHVTAAGSSGGQTPAEDAGSRTPSRLLQVLQEELMELDSVAALTDAGGGDWVSLGGSPAHWGQQDSPGGRIEAPFSCPAQQVARTELSEDGGSPTDWSEAGTASPVPQQESGTPVPSYRILRPSVSPQSSIWVPPAPEVASWPIFGALPAGQETATPESSKAGACGSNDSRSPVIHMHGGRRVLGELQSNSPLLHGREKENCQPSPGLPVLEDIAAQAETTVPQPEEDRLTAVYAQIDALSRDLRGTHDELEQLRHAEAQLQGIYEEFAQPDASVAGMTQNSMGARPAAEWSLKISPQQVRELEDAKQVLAQRLEVLTAELADKDARLAHITAQLHHAREQLAAKQREAGVLLGENLGLQDILTEAGADAAAMAAQLAALEAQLERSQARVQEVETQLADREAELAQCRWHLVRTEQLLEKARQAAAVKTPAHTAASATAQPQKAGATVNEFGAQEEFTFPSGDATGAASRPRPSSAEELSRAMVTPPVAERRAAGREGSVGLTPPFTPFTDNPTRRPGLAFHNGKSPAWAAATPVLRPFVAHRPGSGTGGRSAWDVPSPSPMGASSVSNAALASVLAAIRAREFGDDRQTGENVRSEQQNLPITPLASVLRRMQGSRNTSMETAS
ncbi:g2966 [Coccomyxa elongata]